MSTTPPRPSPARRPDESMTLITEMMQRPLDPSYAAEADRREAAGLARTPQGTTVRATLVMVFIGLLMASAAMALRQPKEVVTAQKAALISQIERDQATLDSLEREMAGWQAEIVAAREKVLAAPSREQLAARLDRAEVGSGARGVHGPGLIVTVDDARTTGKTSGDGDPRTSSEDEGRVQSSDLQLVVNGLWEAGAEAMDINGHRLTSTSAIRFAGEAILVDYRPLARPYVIHAIGDPGDLRRRFADSEGGKALEQLGTDVGIEHSVSEDKDLTLPGDPRTTLRHAHVTPTAAPRPSEATTSGTSRPTPDTTRSTTTTEANP